MKDHEKYLSLLSAYYDGELSGADRAEIESHIIACKECSDLLEAYEAVSGEITALQAEPPESLLSDIMDVVHADKAAADGVETKRTDPEKKRVWKPRRFTFGVGTAVAAIAAIAIMYSAGTFDSFIGVNSARSESYDTVSNAQMAESIEAESRIEAPAAYAMIEPVSEAETEGRGGEAPSPLEAASVQDEALEGGGTDSIKITSSGLTGNDEAAEDDSADYTGEAALIPEEDMSLTISAVISYVEYSDQNMILYVEYMDADRVIDIDQPIVVSNSMAEEASDIIYEGNTVQMTLSISVTESVAVYELVAIGDE